jgi:hypothetical protein
MAELVEATSPMAELVEATAPVAELVEAKAQRLLDNAVGANNYSPFPACAPLILMYTYASSRATARVAPTTFSDEHVGAHLRVRPLPRCAPFSRACLGIKKITPPGSSFFAIAVRRPGGAVEFVRN